MSDLKFETSTKFKSLDKHPDNNTFNKSSSHNNRPLFLVKQNQENNEKLEKNFITKEDMNTNHSNNTTNENISQDKANLSKEIINEKEETMIIERKEKENQIPKIAKEFNTNIDSKMIKPSINHPFIMNNNNIENNLMFQRNNGLNNNCYNNIHGNNSNIINNSNNEQNNKFITESPQNKRSLRGHSVKPSIHHLLEDAIIKKEFQEPKRKVVLKNDLPPSYGISGANDPTKSFQKIINIDESDSFIEEENESDFSQDFEEEDDDEDDEEYNITNNNINWLNRRKKDKVNSLYNNFPKRKEYDNPICAELNELIKNFGFDKVIESIYQNRAEKLNNKEINNSPIKNNNTIEQKENKEKQDNESINSNKVEEIKQDQKMEESQDLSKKINEILSKSNIDDINLLLIRILSDNFTENQQRLYDFISKKRERTDSNYIPQIEIKDADDRFQKRSKSLYMNSSLGILKEKRRHTKRPSPPFYYGKHYYKKNGKIYCYVPKAKTVSFNRYTLYCLYRGSKEKCMAKIIVHQNGKDITFVGNHMCKPKMTMEDFCKKYPNVKNTDWTHIQFAFRNQKLIVMNQS